MAVTKLMHIKEQKGNPSAGLKKCIRYIMDPQKSEGGTWTSSNCGDTPQECYEEMIKTKQEFRKTDGRQGYHFVLSFPPGETDELTVFNVAKEFCETYLGEEYEYCFAVHNDHAHLHAHIVFNSVSRADGKKYHYANGDWKTLIQPVTDAAAEEYGLPPLTYEDDHTVGVEYDEWLDQKKGNFMPEIRVDLDAAIREAATYEDFLERIRRKYQIRFGWSERWKSEYFTLLCPEMGMKKPRRNYTLGRVYTVPNIKWRIRQKSLPAPYVVSGILLKLVIASVRLEAGKKQPHYSRQQK